MLRIRGHVSRLQKCYFPLMKDLSSQSKPPMCPWSKASYSPFIYLRPHCIQALAEMMLISQKAIIEGEDHFLETRKTFAFVSDYSQQVLCRERPKVRNTYPFALLLWKWQKWVTQILVFCSNENFRTCFNSMPWNNELFIYSIAQ